MHDSILIHRQPECRLPQLLDAELSLFSLMKHARLPFGVDLQYPGEDVLRGAPMPSLSPGILLTGKRPRIGTRHQAKSAQAKEVAHRREAGHRERKGDETGNNIVGGSSMYRRQSDII